MNRPDVASAAEGAGPADREIVSPDGQLRLLVISSDGDLTVGFAGCPAHTHGSILAAQFGTGEAEAVARFVAGIIEGQQVIAVWRARGRVRDVWVPEHEGRSLHDELADVAGYGEPGETVEFRLWDGTRVQPPRR